MTILLIIWQYCWPAISSSAIRLDVEADDDWRAHWISEIQIFKGKIFIKKNEYLQFGQTSLCRRRSRPLGLPRRHELFKIIIELFMLIPIMSFLLKKFVHLHSTKLLKTKAQFGQQLHDLSSSDSRENVVFDHCSLKSP